MDELRSYIVSLLKEGKRVDGRGLTDYREPVVVKYHVSETAEGSAEVRIGDTIVMAGVKLSIETPYPDTPDQGGIMVNVELYPMSSPDYEPGPPGIAAVELARVVDRGIRESKAIDLRKLCIEKGEKAWTVNIDIVTINDAGNLFDACALVAMAALRDTVFPKYENGELNYKEKSKKKLPVAKEPVSVTVYKVDKSYIVDADQDESTAYDSRLTVASTPDGQLSALQKGGDMPLTVDDISAMVDIALERASFLRGKLNGG
ncbi:MAG TPA: exosome complex protein Rrp42 [Candidatus Nanoarchaeia archaeon]|nr:exosome complex protein Rrp42 [Candidatus Nanoarchaeia archaeon]